MKPLRRWLSSAESVDAAGVQGERGSPVVSQAPSVQSLVSNGLAMGLMLIVGAILLAWYYLHVAGRQTQVRRSVQSATRTRTESEMALPALGRIAAPQLVAASSVAALGNRPSDEGTRPALSNTLPLPSAPYAVNDATTPKSVAPVPRSGLARRLSGAAFVREESQVAAGVGPPDVGATGDERASGHNCGGRSYGFCCGLSAIGCSQLGERWRARDSASWRYRWRSRGPHFTGSATAAA